MRAISDDADLLHRAKYGHVPRDQFDYFLRVADRVGLDPWTDQIYCEMQADHRRRGRKVLKVFIGIGGARAVAQRTGERDGSEPAEFERDAAGALVLARVTVYRRYGDRRVAYTGEARMDEYYNGAADPVWRQYPTVCLRRCAEMQALREAFAEELNGLHLREEVRRDADDREGEPEQPAFPDDEGSAPAPPPELATLAVDRGTLQRFLIDAMGVTNLALRAAVTERLRDEFRLADDPDAYARAAAAVRADPARYGIV